MSNLVFPVLRGLEWDVERDVMFSTNIQRSSSGREVRIAEQQIPLWKWTMSVSILDRSKLQAGQTFDDFARLFGFYMQLLGAYDSFLYEDPTDCTLAAENIGTGDAITTGYQITRNLGGYKESIYDIQPSPALQLFVNDWEGNQLQYSTSRTNLLTRSMDLSDASWTKPANFTVTADTTVAPDGTTTADTITDSETVASSSVAKNTTVPNDSATYTFSFYLKAGTGAVTAIKTALTNGTTPIQLWVAINPANGQFSAFSLGPAPASVQVTALPNGWFRVSWQITNNSTGNTILGISIRPAAAAALAGNGLGFTTNENVALTGTNIVWGFQIETGAVATSFIPTVAASASVTDYSINSTGLITFAIAPLTAAAITVTGKFYFRCRFSDEDMSASSGGSGALVASNFSNNFWEAKTIAIVQVKP